MNRVEHIKYVGAEDDNLDFFESQYPVPAGISYNSYMIVDQSIAIIDAVDLRRRDEWLASVSASLPQEREPDYLVVQHMEPDHSGSIRAFIEKYPSAKIVCTKKAADMLSNFFEDIEFGGRVIVVADGDCLSTGSKKLEFITAPMVHWPEVMVTLDETDGVLFSADAFGSFALSTAEAGRAWDDEARRYYANIVGRFGPNVQSLMKKLTGRKFHAIAPLHGPVLDDDLPHYWSLYDKWSRYEPEKQGVLVAYASIYGGTAAAAHLIAERLRNDSRAGEVVEIDLCRHDVSFPVAEAFRLSRMVLCAATYDSGLFPAMHNFLHHLASRRLAGRRVALVENGSWAPAAGKIMRDALGAMKGMTVVEPMLSIRSRLHESDASTVKALCESLLAD